MTNRSRIGAGRGLAALIPTAPPGMEDSQSHSAGSSARKPTSKTLPKSKRASSTRSAQSQQDQSPSSETAPLDVAGLELVNVRVSDIAPNPQQPRTQFDPDALEELAVSLKEIGFLQPVVVRRTKTGFELVAGERRLRASKLAKFDQIPAIVRSTTDDVLLRDALIENLQRVQLNPIEEAAAYDQLLSDFGGTHEELADKLGRSRPQVSNTLRLLKLSPAVQRRVAAGVLSAGHARALVSIKDPDLADKLAARVVAEGISVRGLEEIIAMGVDGSKPAKKRRSSSSSLVEYEAVADRLADSLDTRVKVSGTANRGRISIDFAGVEDLARIMEILERD